MRNIESFAHLIESKELSVLGQHRLQLQPRGIQQFSQRVFIFVAVQSSERCSSPSCDQLFVKVHKDWEQGTSKFTSLLFGHGVVWRHLARLHSIVNQSPCVQIFPAKTFI